MCKRSVARFNSSKRTKQESCSYTQGPLDDTFGQHRAFPLDAAPLTGEDAKVYEYLRSVRQEAETDAPVHSVARPPHVSSMPRVTGSPQLPAEYVQLVISRLEQEKLANGQRLAQNGAIEAGSIIVDAEEIERGTEEALAGAEEAMAGAEEIMAGAEEIIGQTYPDSRPLHENSQVSVPQLQTGSELPQTVPEFPEVPQSAGAWRSFVLSLSPPPIDYFNTVLEHATIIKLIVYYTKWLLVSMPPTLAQWIFVTFVRLDNGLDHTEMALVRDLGRKARKLRTKFIEGKKEGLEIPQVAEETVDMILAVVGVYYGQRDLLNEE